MDIFGHLIADVDDAQRVHHLLGAVAVGQSAILDEMARKIDVGAELAGELKGLDHAVQHGITPVVDHLAQLHGAIGNTGPIGTVVIHGVGQFHPAAAFQFLQIFPKRIHDVSSFCFFGCSYYKVAGEPCKVFFTC